jgi:hypothetical protein
VATANINKDICLCFLSGALQLTSDQYFYLFLLFQNGPYLSIVRDSCGLLYPLVLALNIHNKMSDKIVVGVSGLVVVMNYANSSSHYALNMF